MDAAIEFLDVHYAYPNRPEALRGVNAAIGTGKKIAVVGPNGAGKTTLLLMCNGTLRPNRGEVRLFGSPLQYDGRSLREARRRVGMVFQNSDAQLFAPTVYQDVAFGPVNLGLPQEHVRRRVEDALYAVGLGGYEKRPPHRLSGGEKKRAAIAGVLAMEPDILIFDEPTSSLDPAGAAETMDLLDELHERGTLVVISTHDVELAYRWADDVILMAEGTVLRRAPPGVLFADPELVRRARLTMPQLLELHSALTARGLLDGGDPPSGVLEMVQNIERAAGRGAAGERGAIYLMDAKACDGGTVHRMLACGQICAIGAMGTHAKQRLEQERIVPQFTHDVIDRCLMEAILGRSTLIVTSGGMLQRVQQRVEAFCERSRLRVSAILLEAAVPPGNPRTQDDSA